MEDVDSWMVTVVVADDVVELLLTVTVASAVVAAAAAVFPVRMNSSMSSVQRFQLASEQLAGSRHVLYE